MCEIFFKLKNVLMLNHNGKPWGWISGITFFNLLGYLDSSEALWEQIAKHGGIEKREKVWVFQPRPYIENSRG